MSDDSFELPVPPASASGIVAVVPAIEAPAATKRLIRLADLFAAIDVKKATGHRLIGAGKIGPRAIRLTPACVRYDAAEVDAWLRHRKPDGNLHDARTWPPVWEMIQRKPN